MKTAVDSNILFDLLAGDQEAAASARQALSQVLDAGPVVICPVVYGELAAGFASHEELKRFVHDLQLHVEDFSTDSLLEAGTAWKRYATRRGVHTQCPRCGQKAVLRCPACQATVTWRQHIIPDFLVGGHASRQADGLLTRDTGYYRTYFPRLRLVAPASDG